MARWLSRRTCGLVVVSIVAVAGCTHSDPSVTADSTSQQPAPSRSTVLQSIAPSPIASSRYSTLPQTVRTRTVEESPVCRYQRAASSLRIAATPGEPRATSAGKSASEASLRTLASYVLTTSTTIRAYPAQLIDPPTIPTARTVWVIE
jgi:hypothetical protein